VIAALEQALYFTMIISYAQGMQLLSNASAEYKYDLHLGEIAKIWRGGCIIRSKFLNDIFKAYEKDAKLEHLLLDSQCTSIG
jgi:6-phosphogluconate dehydrogenase